MCRSVRRCRAAAQFLDLSVDLDLSQLDRSRDRVRLAESGLLGHHPAAHLRDLLARRFLLGEQRCHLSSEGDDIWVLLGVLRQKLAKRSLDLDDAALGVVRSEEHTSELQSLMRISYAVFCLKKKKTT